MHPVICKIGPFTIYSYGLAMAAAFIVCAFLAGRQSRRIGSSPELIFNFCFLVFVSGIIGARLFYIGYHPAYYLHHPLQIIMLQEGGLSWFGGLILGSAAGLYYLKKKKLPIGKMVDFLAPYLALGQAIGRIGCFLNGCCYGKPSRFGIYFPVHDAVLIPTQLYSAFSLFAIFLLLGRMREKPHRDGEIFLYYVLFSCLARFVIEFFRDDNPVLYWGMTIFHFASLIGMIVSVALLVFLARWPNKNARIQR